MTARISLTMIVKNEASTLARCLASVRDLEGKIGVSSFLVWKWKSELTPIFDARCVA